MEAIKQWLATYWQLVGLAVAGIALLAWLQWGGTQPPATTLTPSSSSESSLVVSSTAEAASSQSSNRSGFVHIKGAVVNPGLYPVTGATRWQAVVEAAGGLTAEADVTTVNLAQVANDQESLYIPAIGESPPAGATVASGAPSTQAGAQALVNLNTADESVLQTLSGIGPKRAADIIAYRTANGPFASVADLINVSGIGEKTVERLTPLVTVGP